METRNVAILGSGPAGLTAALYAARANLNPVVIEGIEAGGQLMLTTMVENFPGYRDGIMGPDLMAEMRAQAERFGAQIIQGNVTKVDLGVRPFTIATSESAYAARALIVATGGLDDTVKDYNPKTGSGTGFKFKDYTAGALLDTLERALNAYHKPKVWKSLQVAGMRQDFSWDKSALQYVKLYERAVAAGRRRAVMAEA